MKTKCRILFAALPAVGLLGIALCAASARAEDKKPVVGLVMKSLANEFFKSMEEGARKFAAQDGKACAALIPITEDTDLEALALSQNKRFWSLFDAAYARAEKEGWVDLDDLN